MYLYSDSLTPEVVATRVKNLLVAMDTDNYTLPKRRTDYVSIKYGDMYHVIHPIYNSYMLKRQQ